jgi:hypothetical protein
MIAHCPATTFANPASAATIRVYLAHGHFESRRGQSYNVHFGTPDGNLIAANRFDPEYAACRALVALGVTGKLEVWRPGSVAPGHSEVSPTDDQGGCAKGSLHGRLQAAQRARSGGR